MRFTHVTRARRHLDPAPYSWTDLIVEGSEYRIRSIRSAYRTLRTAGLSERDARGILWDLVAAGRDARTADHDCLHPYSNHNTTTTNHTHPLTGAQS